MQSFFMHGFDILKNILPMPFKRTYIAAFFILIFSWCTYQGYESLYFFRIPTTTKHIINFSLLLLVFVTGLFGFSKLRVRWVVGIWVPVYAIIILLMAVIGLLDLKYRFRISNFREMVHNLRLFFSSPVPYGILLLLAEKTGNKKPVIISPAEE